MKSLQRIAVAINRSRMASFLFILLLLSVSITSTLHAQVPRKITYQGQALNNGVALSGPHTIVVKYYTSSSSTPLFSETFNNVQFSNGTFNIILGSTAAFPTAMTFGEQYFIGITIDNGTELAKTPMAAAPYALHATVADALSGSSPTGVTGINGQTGDITIVGAGSTTVTKNGNQITISSSGSGGTGMQGLQNIDGSLTITNPNGPTATASVAANGITTAKIADGAVTTVKLTDGAVTTVKIADAGVTTAKLADAAVTTAKIVNGAITPAKIAQSGAVVGQVMKWDGTAWSPGADLGLVLPAALLMASATDALSITNNGAGTAITGINNGLGKGGSFKQTAVGGSSDALYAESNGSGAALHAVANGSGRSGFFEKGNVEIGGPGATLVLSAIVFAPAAPAILIPNGLSIFKITLTPGAQANALTGPPTAVQGQILYVVNDDDDPATLAGGVIAAGAVRQFIFIGGVWRIVG